jgi:hypothetical protein
MTDTLQHHDSDQAPGKSAVAVWARYSTSAAVAVELAAYGANQFVIPDVLPALPLTDEAHVAEWRIIAARAAEAGAWVALSECLLQLHFPIETGISLSPGYTAVVRRGEREKLPDVALHAVDADGIQIFLHPTAAGTIPVITCRARADFETLVIACTRRNEPAQIPATMGACVVAGYNNWNRVEREWRAAVEATPTLDRATFLTQLLPQKSRYQDRFILLSSGPYSSVPAARLGLQDAEWLALSLDIRRTHEATHYFTKRLFGTMHNALFDEILADYAGIVAARGAYSAEWFCRFMGVELQTGVYTGGRLQNYCGSPALSPAAFEGLARAVADAARSLEHFDDERRRRRPHVSLSTILTELARNGLLALLSEGARVMRSDAYRSGTNLALS